MQATDADQGENGRVLYRILTGRWCDTFSFLSYYLRIVFLKQTKKQSITVALYAVVQMGCMVKKNIVVMIQTSLIYLSFSTL